MIILFLYSRNYIIFYISGLYNPKMHPACQKHGEIKDNSADYMVLSCNPKTWMQRRKTCRCSLVNYCVKHQQCRDKKLIYTILQMLEFSLKRSSYTIIDFRIIIQMMIFFLFSYIGSITNLSYASLIPFPCIHWNSNHRHTQ